MPMDQQQIEAPYRRWWAEHTVEQRRHLQGMDRSESPQQISEPTTDVDGDPLGVETKPNPNWGTFSVPYFIMTWNADDDEPVTLTEEDDDDN